MKYTPTQLQEMANRIQGAPIRTRSQFFAEMSQRTGQPMANVIAATNRIAVGSYRGA